jgi:hypothetical protein
MPFLRRTALLVVVWAGAGSAFGQSPAHRTAPSKKYCHPSAGFCFRYPDSWTVLGEVFDGNGVVVAPSQEGNRAQWNEITVALMIPSPEDGHEVTLDGVVEQASSSMRQAGQNFVTLQRQERTVDHNPAQLLKVSYREGSTGREWMEEVVFIQGPENGIYSVALKSSPEHLARLEPAFREVLASWILPAPQIPQDAVSETTPAQTAPSHPPSEPPHQP